MVSEKIIGRLSLYRRLLSGLLADGARNVYSHQLAKIAGGTAAQVRRDVMAVGYTGSPIRGYDVQELMESIGRVLDAPAPQGVALVGIGKLGRAVMAYFTGRRPNLAIVAAFDNDPSKTDRVIHGCRCFPVGDLERVLREQDLHVAIIAVPAPEAQGVADALVRAHVTGILNFAPVRLQVPLHVHVEDIDMTMSLEKAAFFARQSAVEKELER